MMFGDGIKKKKTKQKTMEKKNLFKTNTKIEEEKCCTVKPY